VTVVTGLRRRYDSEVKSIPPTRTVLFLCTGNSCRSQMAEGWARALHGERLNAYSAGTAPHAVDPRAILVMREAGVDISGHRSKSLSDLEGVDFDWVVTVCDTAQETCPVFPGTVRRLHRDFEDPPRLAKGEAAEAAALAHYRRVRDEIRSFVTSLPASMDGAEPEAASISGALP